MQWISRTLGVLVVVALVAGAVFAIADFIRAGNLAGGPRGGVGGPVKAGMAAAAEKTVAGDGPGAAVDRRSLGDKPAGGGEGGHGGASLARALPAAARDLTILGLGVLAFWGLQAWLIRRGAMQHRSASTMTAPDSH
jgi:hypothetical protein